MQTHVSAFSNCIRFILEDRAYGVARNSKYNHTKTKYAPDMHIGHEITVFSSVEFLNWRITQKKGGYSPDEKISPIHVSTIAPGIFLRYAYQFPISTTTGFFLGTTMGFAFSELQNGKRQFRSGYSVFFPTILGGFAGNPSESDRIIIGIEYSGIFYPTMVIYTDEGLRKPLNATLDAYDVFIENEYFLSDQFALSAGGGVRFINNMCQLSFVCSSTNYLNTLKINNIEYFAEIGVIFGDLRR